MDWIVVFSSFTLGAWLVFSWVRRRPARQEVCRYSVFHVGMFMFSAIMFGLIFVSLLIPDFYAPGLNDEAWLLPAFGIVSMIFLWVVMETMCREISWDDKGIVVRRWWSRREAVSWNYIVGTTENEKLGYTRLDLSDERGIGVSETMDGYHDLMDALRERGIE